MLSAVVRAGAEETPVQRHRARCDEVPGLPAGRAQHVDPEDSIEANRSGLEGIPHATQPSLTEAGPGNPADAVRWTG